MHYLALYNSSAVVRFPLVVRNSVDLAVKATFTPANGDCNISKDGGAQANPANNLNIVTGTTWNVTLSASELSAKEVVLMVRNNSAVEDQWVTIRTYGNASAYYAWNMEAGNLPADLRQIAGSALSGPATAGILDVNIKNVNNVAANTNLPVDLRQIVGAAVSGPQTAGVLDVNLKNVNNAAFNANQAQFGTSVVSIVANAITAAAFNANAITGAKVAADVDIRNVTGNVTGNIGGSLAGSVGSVTGNVTVGAIANNAITSVVFNANAITGRVVFNDVDIRNVNGNVTGNVTGTVGSVTGNVGNVTGNLGGTVASVINLNAQLVDAAVSSRATPAQVKTQVVAALSSDTYAEPPQGNPAATLDIATKLGYLYKAWRNKTTQTNNTLSLFADDAVTVDQKSAVSDDGTTYTRGEIATGP